MDLKESIKNICRLCASHLTDVSIPIYSFAAEEEEVSKYSVLVNMITDKIDFTNIDELPKLICETCALNLKTFYYFKRQIEESNIFFADMLSNSKKEIEKKKEEEQKLKDSENNSIRMLNNVAKEEIVVLSDTDSDNEEEKHLVKNNECNETAVRDMPSVSEISSFNILAKNQVLRKKDCSTSSDNENNKFRFETNTKQLSPEEQSKWQQKLNGWIKNQTKQTRPKFSKYMCENCGKTYGTKYALKQHEYVHTGVMDFECSECGRKFGQKKNLNAHMQIKHIKTKFFTCTICGRVFNRSSTLAKHRWVHMDVRPFKCEYCEKTFKWKTCYKFHLNTHTKEVLYNCYLCDKVYESRASRRKHCLKFHDGLGRVPLEETKKNSE